MVLAGSMSYRAIPAILLLFGSLGGVPAPLSAAASSADREAALAQLRTKIEMLRKDIAATQTLHDNVRSELATLERQIGDVHNQLRKLKREQSRQEQKLTQLGHEQQQLQRDVAAQQDLLGRQMQAAYMMGQQETLKIWLNAQDPALMGRTGRYYDYLHRARAQRIGQTRQTIERLRQLSESIAQERTALAELQHAQQTKKQELLTRSQDRSNVVRRLRAELQSKEQQLQSTLEDERRLQQLVTSLRNLVPDVLAIPGQRQAFDKLKGKLRWPAAGKVQDSFGKRRESGSTRTNGVVILADEGREVRAVSHGRVAYADWLRGYGLLVILDHGEGFMSLYGHTQAIYKEPGEWVEAGELIASVGNSGGVNQPGLYFEIRQNGKPANPGQWCRR